MNIEGRNDVPLEVSSTSMNQDSYEEDRIEVRNGSCEANDSSPCEAHSPVGDVVL